MKTKQEINEEINALIKESQKLDDDEIDTILSGLFNKMDKKQIKAKIKEMMEESQMMKMEVKRLLIDSQSQV